MYTYTDYFKTYGRIMQFNKNKLEPFHRWYPFVEGYSKEFIQSILNEIGNTELVCLEPFSGSGTTALELQNSGIECYSFEVNPLMYNIARVKLENSYEIEDLRRWFDYIVNTRSTTEIKSLCSNFDTLYEGNNKDKWNYDTEVAIGIERLLISIDSITDEKYKELYRVALASILLDVSNLYRNGKCLSYKKDWKNRKLKEEDVFERFDNKVKNELEEDINNFLVKASISNKNKLYNEDSRVGISKKIKNDSINLVITSPPYLNSRDYTDTYMLELKTLGFTPDYDNVRELREKTLRSHVQIKWEDETSIDNELLSNTLCELNKEAEKIDVWNDSIVDMVRLYFVDMQKIFRVIYTKLKTGGKVYFNISNSAYFNVLVNTLEICASIAENEGYKVIEIRKARKLKTSPQQKEAIGFLLEGVIVLEK